MPSYQAVPLMAERARDPMSEQTPQPPMLLTKADERRLQEVKAQIDQAIAAKKRTGQLLPLLDAQKLLLEITQWFIARDCL